MNSMKNVYWVKRSKFRYVQKQLYLLKGISKGNYYFLKYGMLLKSLCPKFLDAGAVEASRKILRHFLRKSLKISINLICWKPRTIKSTGTRMGKGKGAVKDWLLPMRSGRVLLGIQNMNIFQGRFVLEKAQKKFGFQTKIFNQSFQKHSIGKKNLFY